MIVWPFKCNMILITFGNNVFNIIAKLSKITVNYKKEDLIKNGKATSSVVLIHLDALRIIFFTDNKNLVQMNQKYQKTHWTI